MNVEFKKKPKGKAAKKGKKGAAGGSADTA